MSLKDLSITCVAWLRNCDVNNAAVKGLKKLQLVEATLIAIERLLPDSCGECQEEYTVTREETPSLQCAGCQQGFHQECLASLTGSETFPKFPGKLLWLCSGCEPCYSLMTTVGPDGNAKPNSKRTVETPAEPVTATAEPTAEPTEATEDSAQPNPPPNPPHSERTPVVDCPLLLKNNCPHGLSGKKGGVCDFQHRQRCLKYMKWGDKHPKGCKLSQCPKLHPDLCVRSLALECYDKKCEARLHTKKCKRSTPKPAKSHQPGAGQGQPKSRTGNSGTYPRPVQRRQNSGNGGQNRDPVPREQQQKTDGQGPIQSQVWQAQANQSFPNLTVQPQLEAFMQALIKQQQELTKIALKEMAARLGTCGVRGSCHPHSNC